MRRAPPMATPSSSNAIGRSFPTASDSRPRNSAPASVPTMAPTIPAVARNEAGYEYNWHSEQRPIGFDLCGHFSAIKLRHYKIKEDQIRPEAACRFHRTRCVIFFTDDVLARILAKSDARCD